MRWDLTALYENFKDPQIEKDFKTLRETLTTLTEKISEETLTESLLEEALEKQMTLRQLMSKLGAFGRLSLSVESSNGDARDHLTKLQALSGDFAKLNTLFTKALAEVDLDFFENNLIKEHLFVLKERQEEAKRMLSEKEEVLLAKLRNTGSSAFSTLQSDQVSNLTTKVIIHGEEQELPLPALRNLANHEDQQVRKAGFEAELKAYPAIEEAGAAAMSAIKGEVITVAELKGYESPLDETIQDSRLDKETLDALLTAMEEYLPEFWRYLNRKAEILGDDKLPFYDILAPLGEVDLTFTYDEAMDYIVKQYEKVHEPLARYVEHAWKDDWLDVEMRKGKRAGAFCSNLHVIGESRIMSNFDGSFSSLSTLAHELGHGYHGHNLKEESILNASYTMPIAETASIFNEILIIKSAMKDVDDQGKIALLNDSITRSNQVITDIYSRFIFEKDVFETRKTKTLSAKELCEKMINAQKKAYGEGLDHEVLHPYMWLNKPHYYSTLSYYNFPYAFGLLLGQALVNKYEEEGPAFMPKYDKFLSVTGKMTIADAAKTIGIDIRDPEFFRNSLEAIKGEIDQFIELTESLV